MRALSETSSNSGQLQWGGLVARFWPRATRHSQCRGDKASETGPAWCTAAPARWQCGAHLRPAHGVGATAGRQGTVAVVLVGLRPWLRLRVAQEDKAALCVWRSSASAQAARRAQCVIWTHSAAAKWAPAPWRPPTTPCPLHRSPGAPRRRDCGCDRRTDLARRRGGGGLSSGVGLQRRADADDAPAQGQRAATGGGDDSAHGEGGGHRRCGEHGGGHRLLPLYTSHPPGFMALRRSGPGRGVP